MLPLLLSTGQPSWTVCLQLKLKCGSSPTNIQSPLAAFNYSKLSQHTTQPQDKQKQKEHPHLTPDHCKSIQIAPLYSLNSVIPASSLSSRAQASICSSPALSFVRSLVFNGCSLLMVKLCGPPLNSSVVGN